MKEGPGAQRRAAFGVQGAEGWDIVPKNGGRGGKGLLKKP